MRLKDMLEIDSWENLLLIRFQKRKFTIMLTGGILGMIGVIALILYTEGMASQGWVSFAALSAFFVILIPIGVAWLERGHRYIPRAIAFTSGGFYLKYAGNQVDLFRWD